MVTSKTLDYYSELFALPEASVVSLCRPYTVFNPEDTPLGFSVRNVHHADAMPPSLAWKVEHNFSQYGMRLGRHALQAVSATEEIPDQVWYGPQFYMGDIVKKLIDPKIKTGRITELSILTLSPNEVPAQITVTDTITKKYYQQFSLYYLLGGLARIGSRSATIGCAIRLTPAAEETKLRHETRSKLILDTRVKRLGERHANALSLWHAGIDQSIDREASARLHPFSGGLPS